MDLNNWLGTTMALSTWRDDIDSAYDTARVIAEQSTSITIRRGSSTLAAQTVRIEPLGGPGKALGPTATVVSAGILVVGYKAHPSITDTDIQRGDRFLHDGQMYTITQVLPEVPNRMLAIGEAQE